MRYGHALRCYASSLARRDFHGALAALDQAVALEPGLVEPRHLRRRLRRLTGDYVGSSRDYAACVALDAHYLDRDRIAASAQALAEAYCRDAVLDSVGDPRTCRDRELRMALEARLAEATRRTALFASPSCDLPCPSLCCRFEEEAFVYGVHLRAGELDEVAAHLGAAGLDPKDYLASVAPEQCPERVRERRDGFLRDGRGGERLHYVRRREGPIGCSPGPIPRSLSGGEVAWVTSRSRPCMFVSDAGCAIHDVGDPPGIAACRAFLCLTAFVLLVARDQGLVKAETLAGRSMFQLQETSYRLLPLLAAWLCSPAVATRRRTMRRELAAAVESDARDDAAAARAALARYAAAVRENDEEGCAFREQLAQLLEAQP